MKKLFEILAAILGGVVVVFLQLSFFGIFIILALYCGSRVLQWIVNLFNL